MVTFSRTHYRYFVDSGFCLGLNPSNSVDLSSNCSGYMSESGAISRVNKVALERLAEGLSQVIEWRHESLFTRFERKSPACRRPGESSPRDCEHVWCLPGDAQTLSQATTRDGKPPPQADSSATVQEMRSLGGRDHFPTEGARRCHLRRALSALGGEHGDAGKYHTNPQPGVRIVALASCG